MASRVYRFGAYTLDPAKRELAKGREPVPLVGNSLGVLIYLVENHARLVSSEEVFRAVWGKDKIFDPQYIQNALTAIRKALGDNAREPMYVVVERARGIRLLPAVEVVVSAPGAQAPPPGDGIPRKAVIPLLI